MEDKIQDAVTKVWPLVSTENLEELTDFEGYQTDFLRLFGFGIKGVDYEAEVEPEVDFG
jgi:enoyl-[acyl-carrier protein] reductase/trans-2-enoyl-CoA reductase (NAD+)